MNSEPLVNHRDSMAKKISHTVAISDLIHLFQIVLVLYHRYSLTINILLLLLLMESFLLSFLFKQP